MGKSWKPPMMIDAGGITVGNAGAALPDVLDKKLSVNSSQGVDPDGTWERKSWQFDDGTMICAGYSWVPGELGYVHAGFNTPFIDAPFITASINGAIAGDTSPYVGTVHATASMATIYFHANTSN